MIISGCLVRYVHQRRIQERLQQEVSSLLYEYVPMDGNEVETITFNDSTNNKKTDLLDARHI